MIRLVWNSWPPNGGALRFGNVSPFVGSVSGGALPALSAQVWKCIVSVGLMLIRIRRTSRLETRWASYGYRLEPPCSIVAKWNPAVLAIACRCSLGCRSSFDLGIAGNPSVEEIRGRLAGRCRPMRDSSRDYGRASTSLCRR
jgi:hypothetical protein